MVFSVFISLSVYAEVLYENPVENVYGRDINRTSLQELLDEESKRTDDLSVLKSQYMLGVIYTQGVTSWNVDRDLDRGREYLLKAWDNCVADAGYTLAQIYYQGVGVKKDNNKALEYLKESADMGLLLSQRALGKAYLGEGEWKGILSQDISKAIFWLEKAGHAGDLESSITLAYLYWQGELVEENDEAALEWMLKGASSKYGVGSNSEARTRLAEFYEKGIGTKVDLVQAYKYYDLITPAGSDDKARLAKEMTQDQIDEAIRQSRAWQEEHNTFMPSYEGLEYQEDSSFR